LIDSAINDDDLDTNEEFKLQRCYNPPPYRNLGPRFMGEENLIIKSILDTSIGNKKIKRARARKSLGLWVAYPSTDKPWK
jgi:hypothetical protein